MANTYLTRTPSSTSNQQKVTFSVWIKRCKSGGEAIYSIGGSVDQNYYVDLIFDSDFLEMNWYDGSGNHSIKTNRLFRDTSAWYHLVVAIDTTQSTASNRVKIYVNGILETSFSSADYMNQNQNMMFNTSSREIRIGQRVNGSDSANIIMSHFHCADGTALAPTVFGETDSTTGEWKIKVSPSFTPGTNGFTILKDSNTITDQSANSNNFSLGAGAITATKDCPSNVFATLNPLETNRNIMTSSANGNLVIQNNNASWKNGYSTIATPLTGKYYMECKMISNTGTWYTHFGIQEIDDLANNASGYANYGDGAKSWSYSNNGQKNNSGSGSSYGDAIETGDIVGIAIDCTNSKLYFSNQGVWQNSGNPESGSTGTGAISITANQNYFLGGMIYSGYIGFNFGNGLFGTTAITTNSGNGYAGAEGASKFNYAVPSGYSALSTKGLNT